MSKEKALTRLNFVVFSSRMSKGRATELINNPSLISQGKFGICGMAAVVYVFLKHNPVRFVEDILKQMINKKSGQYCQRLLRMYDSKKNQDTNSVDFGVSRYLGLLLEEGDATLYKEQVAFTDFLLGKKTDAGGDGCNIREGDLALNSRGLQYILSTILGLSNVQEEVPSAANIENRAWWENKFVISAQDEWEKAGVPFNHWVVMDRIEKKGSKYRVYFWSRGADVDLGFDMSIADIQSCFPFFITGNIP